MKQVTTIAFIFFVAVLVTVNAARAADGENCFIRLNTLRSELTEYRQSSRRWATAWGITWTTAAVSQLAVSATIQDINTRRDLWVGSASAALGVIPTWIIPPEATRDFELPEPSYSPNSNETCESQLSETESLARRLSADTEIYSGTTAQIGNIAGNLTTALILGLGLGHWGAAAISFAAGVPLGEVMILTYPKPGEQLHKEAHVTVIPSTSGPSFALTFEF